MPRMPPDPEQDDESRATMIAQQSRRYGRYGMRLLLLLAASLTLFTYSSVAAACSLPGAENVLTMGVGLLQSAIVLAGLAVFGLSLIMLTGGKKRWALVGGVGLIIAGYLFPDLITFFAGVPGGEENPMQSVGLGCAFGEGD